MIAESVAAHGGRAHIVAIQGEADAGVARFSHTWVNWGQVGRIVATLRKEGCDELVIAGGVRRPDLWKLRTDAGFFASLPQILGLLRGGDDSVLTRVVRFFEAKGFKVRGAHEVAPDLLADAGPMGAVALSPQALADAGVGLAVRRALGPLDAGQAVVVDRGDVLAIEGAEGTDAMLARVAGMRPRQRLPGGPSSGVLSKGPKPGQELRVDMPAIGPGTVSNVLAAGLAGIAVEAGLVLVLDRVEAVRAGDAAACALQGVPASGAPTGLQEAAARRDAPEPSGRLVGRLTPGASDRMDAAKGLAAVTRLKPYGAGSSAVVVRGHVLAIAGAENVSALLGRVLALRQWGRRGKRRLGVLVSRASDTDADIAALFGAAAAQGLGGIAVSGSAAELAPYEAAARTADAAGLFLIACETGP